jgi:hypothetical protein
MKKDGVWKWLDGFEIEARSRIVARSPMLPIDKILD